MQYITTLFEGFMPLLSEMHADAGSECRSSNYGCVNSVDRSYLKTRKEPACTGFYLQDRPCPSTLRWG